MGTLRNSLADRATLILLAAALVWPLASAAQYKALERDETELSKAEQQQKNNVSFGLILGLNTTQVAAIPVGFVPAPPSVGIIAEGTQIAADTSLKFTRAVLNAPADITYPPNSADQCTYSFTLPQSEAFFKNFLGFWPKFEYGPQTSLVKRAYTDRLFLSSDTAIDFGVLGVPEVVHANTDVNLHLFVDDDTSGFQENSDVAQTVTLGAGVHKVTWTADTQYAPLWDTVIPLGLMAVMALSEWKFGQDVKDLTVDQGRLGKKLEHESIASNAEDLARRLEALDKNIKFYERLKKIVEGLDHPIVGVGTDITTDWLLGQIVNGQTTVSRSRIQLFTVYDVLPPTISTSVAHPRFEATDIGGAKTARYLPTMRGYITASDQCNQPFDVGNDAPTVLPLGDTLVTWTVRDRGPVQGGVDHDGDGIPDDDPFNSRTVTQLVTIEDTQAPILVPPPGVVIESATNVNLADQALGQPLVVDLADLHPTVASSTNSNGVVPPDTRTVVTWSATDNSGNTSLGNQLVTVKTPGTNTAPTVVDLSAKTLTSKAVDIVLTGTDSDVLPFTGAAAGGGGIADPLQFKITQRPQHGEFVAPLYPFFIDDYRTDKVGGLIDYINAQPNRDTLMQSYITAVNTNSLENWMNDQFCQKGQTAPVNFVFNPLFVQVTDDGEQYFLDRYLVCHPNVDSDWATFPRISRWNKNNVFLGAVRLDDNGGGGISPEEAVFRFDRSGFLYFVQPRTGGDPVVSIQRCSANLTDTTNNPPFCFASYFGPIHASNMSNRANPQNAYVDSQRGLVYITTSGAQQRVDVFRLDNAQLLGTLSDDVGVQDFLNQNACATPNTPFFYDAMETDSKGNFYIVDNDCNRIHKFTPSYFDDQGQFVAGTYVGWMGRCAGSNNLACDVPNGRTKGFSCTVAAACTIPVDPATIGLDSGGGLVGQFKNPSFLAVDPNDVVYVADYKNQRIQRFAPDGTFAGQAQSTGNGVNAATDGSFVLGNMGPPKHVTVNSKNFFVVDQSEHFVHVFDTSPFKDVTDSSATVSYVSKFDFHSATDTFAYSVNDGLVDSNSGIVSVAVARNYRQPLPTPQEIALDEDGSSVIVLSGTDPDGILTRDFNGLDSLTFKIVKQPKHGKLTHGGNAGAATLDPGTDVWTYKPDRDYNGPDSFTFTVRDAFTDATVGDDGTAIPEPYGEAAPAAVGVVVHSVNDIPIVRILPPKRIAAGIPVLLQASAYDDNGDNYAATLSWGDGAIDRDGKVVVDQHGTPNDTSDDTTSLTGVVYSADGLSASGHTQMSAMHTYTATGSRKLTLCLRDDGYLEACDTISVNVESLVALGTKVEVSEAKVTDGIPFTSKITVSDSVPAGGVAALDASDVHVTMELPQELRVNQISASQGSCAIDQGILNCSLGTLTNGSSATIDLALRGVGTLIHDRALSLMAIVTTATAAIDDNSVGSAAVSLKAVPNDRNHDGLPNIFAAVYGVSDPAADDDGDGLSNRAEFDAGTSPRNADTDGDGIPDGAEVNIYHTDPLAADSDRDGVSDGDEIRIHGTNPLASDTDGDGMPDSWEVEHGFDPLVADGGGDADHDGLSDADEVRYGSDYLNPDSDGDGLSDGDEVHVYGTNPAAADSDDDALDDGAEVRAGTDPLKPDTDDDGLLDGEEVNQYGTNPLHADTDRDGLPDGWEVRHARNPLIADYALAAGGLSTCALTDRGVECWGRNDVGQAPALVPGLVHPEQITVGFAHACAIDRAANGARSVKCWGDNTYGQRTPPALVEPLQVAAGAYYNCALDRTGATATVVKCWGRNDHGQVSSVPTGLTNPVRVVSAVSGSSSCVVDARPNGPALLCWGQYNNANSAVPSTLTSALDPLALGSEHGCVVDAGNRLCWGLNDQGQAPPGPTPSHAVDLALGGFHSCALEEIARDRYQVTCWGRNVDGQATVPATLVAPVDVVAGSHHSCVLDRGSAKCWGQNTDSEAPASAALNIDPDGDSLSTAVEIARGTDPLDPDTDRDFLTDSVEIAIGTDPLDPDSDDDGLLDGDEVVRQSNPLASDTDGDGVPDGWEVDHGSSPTVADSSSDPDGDGLTNRAEYEAGTDPNLADTDGDGVPDGAELKVFRYEDTGQALGTAISEAVELGDLDGDGDLDALVANRGSPAEVWLNDGKGNFTRSGASAFNNFDAVDVALFDADGDGDLDAVLAHSDPNVPNSFWMNDGHAVFSPAGSMPPPTFSTDGIKYGRFAPGTAQSGAMGLFVANWGPKQAFTLQPPFTLTPVVVTDPLQGNSEDVALGDLNGDGLDDAFVVNRQQPAQVFMNLGGLPARFIEAQRLGTNDFAIAVALGDIDNDGDLDAYQVNFGAGDKIWLNDGHGHFTDSGQSLGSDGGNDVRLVDIDRDGYPEAIVANTGPNRVWLNTKGVLSDSGITMGKETTYGLAVGDLDGDGDPDIFFANDGPNTVWLLNQLKPTNADTDGDGAPDGWEIEHGLDPLDAADGDLDLDGDGLNNRDEYAAHTDPRVADSDHDGIPDGFEVSHGLDPTVDDSALDLDGDGVANLVEYQQGLDPQADDTPPRLTVPANVSANSTGALTAVALGNATAIDARDGAVTPTPDDAGPFAPGRHRVTWSAADVSGNLAQAVQTVDVIPQVNFGVDQRANEGDTVHVAVQLNGPAVTYPILVDYTVSGVATNPEDHDASAGTVTIATGTQAEIIIHLVSDTVFEGDETFTLTMGHVTNAVQGPKSSHTVTIAQANIAPSARIVVSQGGKRVTTATADGGPVTVSAEVIDPNVADSHTFDWSASDGGAFDPADFKDASYAIDPDVLSSGTYRIVLDIADDGTPVLTNRVHAQLRVASAAPTLSTTTDSDRDGIADATEGAGDADGDGVPDYLDPGSSPSTVVYSPDGYLLDTEAGLAIRLGQVAFAQGTAADVSEQSVAEDVEFGYPDGVADFEVTGVEPGGTAKVVVPLHHPIPPNARYRKHAAGGWHDFVVGPNDSLASAPGGDGACPSPGDAAYVPGLHTGDACIELAIQDGGPNDADGRADGTITDPSGLAVPVGVRLEMLPVADRLAAAGTIYNVVLRLRLTSDSGDVELDSLTLRASGSGDDRQIRSVRLFVDGNGNGGVDAGEASIASGTFDQDNGQLVLKMSTPYAVPSGQTYLLVTFDL